MFNLNFGDTNYYPYLQGGILTSVGIIGTFLSGFTIYALIRHVKLPYCQVIINKVIRSKLRCVINDQKHFIKYNLEVTEGIFIHVLCVNRKLLVCIVTGDYFSEFVHPERGSQ